jgi:tetratricopeptide (TPR) repeat protein
MSFFHTLRLLAIVVVVAGLASAVRAQSGGTKGSRGTTAPPPPTTGPNQPNQVIMLSGNVIIADGTPLSEPVFLERVCNGRVSRDGRSDFKGFFTVSLGQYPPGASDSESSAETSGVPGLSPMSTLNSGTPRNTSNATRLLGCELRASLAGFRSSSVLISTEDLGSGVGMVKVGTIVLERMGEAQGATVSATSLSAPKDAKKAYDKGHRAVENNKLPEAQQELEKAVQLHPQYAAAWLDLGWVYAQQNALDKARHAFEQARTADGMFVPAYVGLASIAVRESRWAEAAEFSAHATQLDGVDFPAAFYYNCLANYRLGNMEQAEKSARKAETLGAQHAFPQVSLLLGVMLANRQDYANAADELRAYLKAAPTAPNADKVRQQLAEVEKLGGAPVKAEAAPPAK